MGQVGNVWEWIDTLSTREVWLGDRLTLVFDGTNIVGSTSITDAEVLTFAGVRGTTFFDFDIVGGYNGSVMSNISGGGGEIIPTFDGIGNIGFRVASVIPEPSTYALFGIGAIGLLMVMRRKKTA
jgi:hypothetical protein